MGPSCQTLLRPAGGPPLKQPYPGVARLRRSSTPLDTPRRTPMEFETAAGIVWLLGVGVNRSCLLFDLIFKHKILSRLQEAVMGIATLM
jgi:hypothetical protein